MSTSNFYIEHRALVVTDEDYEYGNCPNVGEGIKSACSRCHERQEILGYGEFDFWTICITAGYYSDATIDYINNEESSLFEDLTSNLPFYCQSKAHYLDELRELQPHFSRSIFYKLTKGVTDLFEVGNIIADYLAQKEEKEVNKAIDKIKADYGYPEIGCLGTFSNGEAVYTQIG